MMRFTAPEYLLLFVLLAWFWRTGRRRTAFSSATAGTRRTALRCTAGALLILTAAGLQVKAGEAPLSIVFVVDLSDSVAGARSEVHRRLDGLMNRLRSQDRAALVLFGAAPVIERPLSAPAPVPERFTADVASEATDIESALRLARISLRPAGLAPSGVEGLAPSAVEGSRRIVLLSDGQQTQGDALREGSVAASEGIAIDVAPPTRARDTRAVVRRLSAPREVSADEPFALTAIAEGRPGSLGELVIRTESGIALRQEVRFSSDGSATATHVVREREAGVYVYRAGILPADSATFGDSEELSAGAVVVVSGEPRVLYVGALRQRLDAVLAPAFKVDFLTPERLPTSPAALIPYDAIVLDDLQPELLNAAQAAALAYHVENRGNGLLVLGSARSLDATILPDGDLGKLLPVDLRPRAGVRAPEMALVVVFDKSGSMDDRAGGAAKIEFARQGVRRVLDAVPPTDAVGVIAFDSAPTVVAPLGIGHDAATIAEHLRGIEPGGSTAMAPAIELAQEWLGAPELARLSRHHVLLISDGRSSPEDAAKLQALVRDGRFRFSVIALGDERDRRLLTTLAEATGGRAYFPADVRDLPALVAREAARVAGGRIVQESFVPQPSLHPIVRGIGTAILPPLGGYVVSAPKPGAELALTSHREDPILATWRYGLGKVAVYTADLHSAWSAQFRASKSFEPLIAGTVRWLARSAGDDSFYVRFQERGDQVRVLVDVTDAGGSYVSLLDAEVSARNPSGVIERILLSESLPGRYEGNITVRHTGAYVVSLAAQSTNGAFDSQMLRGFYWSADRERRNRGVDDVLLSQLAQATGGRLLASETDAFSERTPAYRDVRRWLLSAAFFVFLAELLMPTLATMLAPRLPASAEATAGPPKPWRRRKAGRYVA